MYLRIVVLGAVAMPKVSWFKSLQELKLKVHLHDNDIITADYLGKLITSSINHWVVQLISERLWGSSRRSIVFELFFVGIKFLCQNGLE